MGTELTPSVCFSPNAIFRHAYFTFVVYFFSLLYFLDTESYMKSGPNVLSLLNKVASRFNFDSSNVQK